MSKCNHIADRQPDNRLHGYYISFGPTGIEAIDRILAAVALAAKRYHHTEGWNEIPCEECGESSSELIQRMAEDAAREWRGQGGTGEGGEP